MEDKYILGNRIRNFRKRADMSQMDLELAIGASQGTISRIEGGEVNPLKETLIKIGDTLKLTDNERRYLYGDMFKPADEEEVEKAIESVEEYFNKREVLAYLLDDRFRCITVSKSYQKFLGLSDTQVKNAKLKPLVQVVLSDEFKLKETLDPEAYSEVIENLLYDFKAETGFMVDDESYINSIKYIEKDNYVKEIWKKVNENRSQPHNTNDTRKVTFKVYGQKVIMHFLREPLHYDRRFEIIEYVPTNFVVKLLSKILN